MSEPVGSPDHGADDRGRDGRVSSWWSISLTTKMFVLVLIAVMPALAIQSYNEYDLRRSREEDIRNKTIQITRQFGAEMGEIKEGARQFLGVVSQIPAVNSLDKVECIGLLTALNAKTPYYSVLGVADPAGNVRCVSRPTALTSVADMAFFKRAMAQTDMAVGNYWVDPQSGQKQIHLGERFSNEATGTVAGVVFAGLDLNWLSDHLSERGLTSTQSILIADREGNIIARLPHPELLVGKNMRAGHAAIMDGNTAGWEETKGVDGIDRIFGYVPPALPPKDFFLSAGESKAAAFAAIDRITQRGILLILLGLTLASYAAWIGGRVFILRPIKALLGAATEWRNGNYAARCRLGERQSEIGRLSSAFNEMADAVETRHRGQQQAEDRLQDLNTTLEQRVEERTRELVAANRAKSQFLANMSHEIRTPMNGVLGMAELLLHTKLEPKQRMYVEMGQRSAETMLSLITGILDLSRIEAGKLEIDARNFGLRALMRDVAYVQGAVARQKRLRLSWLLSPNVPTALIGDPVRLTQILNNLVGNAIKFTDRGEVSVIGTLREATANSALLQFEVRDTGIGISDADQAIIFNAFTQADNSDTRRFSGSGLGLSICKDLCALMGGSIEVSSRQGAGSSFRFTVRLGLQPNHVQPIGGDTGVEADLHVLLMDSDVAERATLSRELTVEGMRVEVAANSDEALGAARRAADRGDHFDIILVDVSPPNTEGLNLIGVLRSDPDHAMARIAMLVQPGQTVPDARASTAEPLTKPVRIADLIRYTNETEPHPAVAWSGGAASATAADTPAGQRALIVEDNTINVKVTVGILESLGWHVETAGDGLQALDAHARGHFDVIFMDCQMPKMDGFETTIQIRKREAGCSVHTPIVALTATADHEFRQRCLNAGMDEYVSKPFTRRQIETVLTKVL